MLDKLAFAMQRLKTYTKNFLSQSTKMGGDKLRFYEGGHKAHGGPPQSPH